MLSIDKLKCCKIQYVIQYYVLDKETSLEEYVHNMILMYYQLRDEIKLFSGSPPTYSAKPSERGVIEVINQICSLVETLTLLMMLFFSINLTNIHCTN